MFENIIINYSEGNINTEILLLILGAFIFGFILKWLWEIFFEIEDDEKFILENNNSRLFKKEKVEKKFLKNENLIIKNKLENIEAKVIRVNTNNEEENLNNISKKNLNSKIKFNNNNLKIIEGIGPKIEEILKNNNIVNWKDLSEIDSQKIQLFLEEAGSKFSFHNPKTWPEQAFLAHQNK